MVRVAQQLDEWIGQRNREARAQGVPALGKCRVRLLGQMALFELSPELKLRATDDVDAVVDADHAVRKQLESLLEAQGLALDSLAHEVWMPTETTYSQVYAGQYVLLQVADLEAVLVSKALKAPEKNGRLLTEYIAKGPSPRFIALAEKYDLNLEQFI